jgi:myo-inositol-1(or 4)-monophosphatase
MSDKLEFAKRIVLEAGQLIKSKMVNELEITEKTRFDDLVTNVDVASQDFLVGQILQSYPDDHILAEENGLTADITDSAVWVIDPIDGTTNFIAQGAEFAVMVGYYEAGQGIFGIIYDVMADKLFWGDGAHTYCNDRELTYQRRPFTKGLLGVNAGMYRLNVGGLLDLAKTMLGVRVIGSAGIEVTRILENRSVGYVSNLSPWDYAAGQVLLKPFGFSFLLLDGTNPQYNGRQMVYAVHEDDLLYVKQYIS